MISQMVEKKDNIDDLLIYMISNSKNKDCSFILFTKQYKDIKKIFLEFYNSNDTIEEQYSGINSNCYHIGSYIFKFGNYHIPDVIDDLPQLVKIYYRKNFEIHYSDSVIFLGFEIQEYIEEDYKCCYEDIYELYKSLRKDGYIWIDASFSNVKKKDGKIIIIDSDYIYRENDVDYFNQSSLSSEFEKRYANEVILKK